MIGVILILIGCALLATSLSRMISGSIDFLPAIAYFLSFLVISMSIFMLFKRGF